jgi:peptidoglycan/xylan/chitin deacetylase (PgdA/CDA1 family)
VAALKVKHAIKQTAYRTIGELAALGGLGHRPQSLRILMYHKVNDVPGNPATVTVVTFRAQVEQLVQLGYSVVGLEAVLAHYRDEAALPAHAVLITFDDGYRDVLANALPVLQEYGLPAVLFVSVGHIGSDQPFPHDVRVRDQTGIVNASLTWDEVLYLDRAGVRVESHGVTHRPLASLSDGDARREIVESKAELEQRLGRRVDAYAYVKGSRAHFSPAHEEMLAEAGYKLGFTTVARRNTVSANPLELGRYNGEAYSHRTFELLLRGACDGIAFKDTVAGARAKAALNRALRTTTG